MFCQRCGKYSERAGAHCEFCGGGGGLSANRGTHRGGAQNHPQSAYSHNSDVGGAFWGGLHEPPDSSARHANSYAQRAGTQNRPQSAIYNTPQSGDPFWAQQREPMGGAAYPQMRAGTVAAPAKRQSSKLVLIFGAALAVVAVFAVMAMLFLLPPGNGEVRQGNAGERDIGLLSPTIEGETGNAGRADAELPLNPAEGAQGADPLPPHIESGPGGLDGATAGMFSPRSGGSVLDVLFNAILNQRDTCDLSSFNLLEDDFVNNYDIWKLIDENPAIDYLTEYTWYSTNEVITVVAFNYRIFPSDYRGRLEQSVGLAVDSIKEQLREGYRQAELVCAISDYIVLNCQYAYKPDGITPDIENGSTAYNALLESRAVCEGYAKLFTLLAQQFGLDVIKVSGITGPDAEEHAWNMVMVDGAWYHVDTTWNDPTPDVPGQASHNYLLLSDAAIASQRGGSQQYHAAWDADAPTASDTRYDDAFWVHELAPISFQTMSFDDWTRAINQITFEDAIIDAVENNTYANIARFNYDEDRVAIEIGKLYPSIGFYMIKDSNGIVTMVGDWF